MPSIRSESRDLLEYNAIHRVLICRECQYAIQKSAVSSHLLRHRIYREERQRLLNTIAKLDLAEPEDVPPPTSGLRAIDGLPVISGYRCTWDGCDNLCASVKRMRRHFSEVHIVSNGDFFTRSVKLQTFFRGTKLRYFEVVLSSANETIEIEQTGSRAISDGNISRGEADEGESGDVGMTGSATAMQPSQLPAPNYESNHQPQPSMNIDLETLAYFHHYITVTSLTLPAPQQEPHFWRTDIVHYALKHRWLMCGLLSISACHSSMSTNDTVMCRNHRERAGGFASEYFVGRSASALMAIPTNVESLENAGDRVDYILRFALWAIPIPSPHSGIEAAQSNSFSLQSFVTAIRALSHIDITHSDFEHQEAIFVQAKVILERDTSRFHDLDGAGHALLKRLRLLPSQLSLAFGRPDDVQDVLATLSAIASLVVCCEASFAANEAWKGMARWSIMTTEQFDNMISANKPVALVLITYWTILVKRAEATGFWFLKDTTEKIRREVSERLRAGDGSVMGLVADLIG
jgi:hypothetical protein